MGGQSIPLFDFYMAPGVLKTYRKQLKQTMYDFFELKGFLGLVNFDKIVKSIDSIKSITEIPEEFAKYADNQEVKQTIDFALSKALSKTERSTYQAMESIIHNLNTMHCLPHNEELWVYDSKYYKLDLMSIGNLTEHFEAGRFYALSFNLESQVVEIKEITAATKQDNHRKLVTITIANGQRLTCTDNHKVLTSKLEYLDAGKATYLVTPRSLNLPIPAKKYSMSKFSRGSARHGAVRHGAVIGVTIDERFTKFLATYIMSGRMLDNTLLTCDDKKEFSVLLDLSRQILNGKLESNTAIFLQNNIGSFISEVAGTASDSKKIPFEVIAGNILVQRSFLKAIFSYGIENKDGSVTITLPNSTIVSQMNLMFISEGHLPNIKENTLTLSKGLIAEIGIDADDFVDKKKLTQSNNARITKVENKTLSNSNESYVYDITIKDNENFITRDGFVVHNSRAGAQVPFSSINFGTDTSIEGRMVIKNFLLALDAGLGNGETPIFPISIFKIKEGVSYNPEDPNYDLFKLACKVSAKRLFPNFSFLDAPFNLQYYKPDNHDSEIAYMGCVDGEEEISYTINRVLFEESFEAAWERLSELHHIERISLSEYINLENVEIFDTNANTFVPCKKIMRNCDVGNWYKVTFDDNTALYATEDHPLPIKDRGRVEVKDIAVGDCCFKTHSSERLHITEIESVGFRNRMSYDVETETDRFDLKNVQSHNCRTRVIGNIVDPSREIVTGRGNLSFTSINLPRIALNNRDDIDAFFAELEGTMEVVKGQLLERLAVQGNKRVKNFPFLMGQGVWIDSKNLKPNDKLKKIIKHGTLTVGFIGLAECLKVLVGKHHGESDEAQALGLKIVGFIRKLADEYSARHGLNFSVIATPAEGLSFRFVRIDKALFGEIAGVTDKEYYTNSFHLPVYYNTSVAHKLEVEGPYHALTNAGHISYVELDGDTTNNAEAFETIVRLMKDSGLGYGAINHPVDRDPVCGYTGVINDTCPSCGRSETDGKGGFERIRRITGYLVGTVDKFNDGKRAEERDRVKHKFE